MAITTKENKEEKKQIYQQPRTESINIGPNLSKSPLVFPYDKILIRESHRAQVLALG